MIDMKLQNYIDWDVGGVMFLRERKNYAYRVTLMYADGSRKVRQHSGYKTRKEGEAAKNQIIAELVNGTYAVNGKVTVEELLMYWLENEVRRTAQSSSTYDTYKNMAVNHIIPFMGKKKLAEVNKGDVQRLYQKQAEESGSVARLVKTVLNTSFSYAAANGLLSVNVAEGVRLPKSVGKKPYHTRNIDSSRTLTMDQIKLLIEKARDTPIYLQVLFNVLMGLRRQEINAVRYSDVDYVNRVLYIERQLGKGLRRLDDDNDEMEHTTKNPLPLKTASSKRAVPIPDIVMEAILEERKVYDRKRSRRRSVFKDLDYICCGAYGSPRSRDFHWKHYKKLLKDCGLPDIRWHDLRATYCTLLMKNNFSPKAVSRLAGHAKELITVDVYTDAQNVIPDALPELEEYIDEVMPHEEMPEEGVRIEVDEFFDMDG